MRPILSTVLLCLALVPSWSGDQRLPLPRGATLRAKRVDLYPDDPKRKRLGRLEYLEGVQLVERGQGIGGYSAIHVRGNRITLLNDGGNVLRFRWHGGERITDVQRWALKQGPGSGWTKQDRDSESMAFDPATGHVWVGFERANEIWRYDSELRHATGHVRPRVMRNWPENGGAESMARMPDGSFVVISEEKSVGRGGRKLAVRFAGDPVENPTKGYTFAYQAPPGAFPSDATALPDGRLLVLNRRLRFPDGFSNLIFMIQPDDIAPGKTVRGDQVAELVAPTLHDNFEGITTTRENGRTIVWLVSDDNQLFLQRTLLLKFALIE